MNVSLADEQATLAAGAALAQVLGRQGTGAFVTLSGDLGAGKTTLVRGLLRALGHTGAVRSPTYTLVESYPVAGRLLHHLDWYRLGDQNDLDGLGLRDLAAPEDWVLVEWPERVPSLAGRADLALELAYEDLGRRLTGRAGSPTGERILTNWMNCDA
jgi:tRNA threonylcarbamoyladenosine biosynthesis protein TsaE